MVPEPERGQSQAFSESNDERLAENDTTGAERMLFPGLLQPLQCRPKMKMSAFTKVEMSAFLGGGDLKRCDSPDS